MPTLEDLLRALSICASQGPCEDCYRAEDCSWLDEKECIRLLIGDALDVLEDLLDKGDKR